jgi:membrane protease YdiL (CAAX protease family)
MQDRSGSTVSFFVGTFIATWGLQLPAVAAKAGLLPGPVEGYMPFATLGMLAPLAMATWLSRRAGGRTAVQALFAPLLKWRVHPLWYFVAVLLPGVLLTTILSLLKVVGWSGATLFLPDVRHLIAGIVIAVGEEVGWRGYALPRLQGKYAAFGASGLIALAWTLWHIPMFIGQGVPLSLLLVMFLFFAGGSMTLTWIYNGTGGSLLLVVLAHFGAHLNNSHAALPRETLPLLVHAVIYGAFGYAVLAPSVLRGRGARLRPTTS